MVAPSYIPQDNSEVAPTVRLPLLPTVVLRLLVVVPLVLHLGSLWSLMSDTQLNHFLIKSLLLLASSSVVETLLAVTSNSEVMLVRDYSLFEMSVQYYCFMASRSFVHKFDLDRALVLLECCAAVMHSLLVHVVRLFELRRYRLWLSFLVYLVWSVAAIAICLTVRSDGRVSLLAVGVFYVRLWSRIPSMFVVVIFYAKVLLWEPLWYGVSVGNPSLNEIRSFIRSNTDEEFVVFTFRFADFLLSLRSSYKSADDVTSVELNGTRQEHTLDTTKSGPGGLTRSNCISLSGYLNKVMTVPEDESSLDKIANAKTQTEDTALMMTTMMPTFFKRFQYNAKLFKVLFLKIKEDTLRSMIGGTSVTPMGDVTTPGTKHEQHRKVDLNRYVTPTNYSKFLRRFNVGNPSELESIQRYLLPETDTSPDYTVPSLDSQTEYRRALKTLDLERYIPKEEDTEEIKKELHELLRDTHTQIVENPELLTWYSSVHSILKYELQHDKSCMTRSQYARENPEAVLNEVILERCPLLAEGSVDRQYVELLPEDAQDERSSYCVVCLVEPRNVVLLPCRCLAICDGCRVALGSRGFQKCVCCDTEVGAYIRVNVV